MRIQHLTASMLAVVALYLSGCSQLAPRSTTSAPVAPVASTPPHAPAPPVKIGLALGGGAARGFAHIGVIKALEAQGIVPDVIVGTSAGAVVGALYASGMSGFDLQKVALDLADKQIVGWAWPNRGWLDGEVLQTFINKAVGNRVLEALPRKLSVMATDLKTGEGVAFATGNTGMAVRASAAVPGVFQPVLIAGREYVDGGLVSPIPVREARRLGATFVIAVDISSRPTDGATGSTFDVLMQTFSIMGKTIGRYETADADIAIHPEISSISPTDLAGRHHAILEGEKAAAAVLVELKRKLAKARTNE